MQTVFETETYDMTYKGYLSIDPLSSLRFRVGSNVDLADIVKDVFPSTIFSFHVNWIFCTRQMKECVIIKTINGVLRFEHTLTPGVEKDINPLSGIKGTNLPRPLRFGRNPHSPDSNSNMGRNMYLDSDDISIDSMRPCIPSTGVFGKVSIRSDGKVD